MIIALIKKKNFIFCIMFLSFLFSLTADCQSRNLQNVYGRSHTSLNGRWNYIMGLIQLWILKIQGAI